MLPDFHGNIKVFNTNLYSKNC